VVEVNLKKQSQFVGGQIGVNSYLKGHYGKMTPIWTRKNKAKQTQFYLAPRFIWGLESELKKQSQLTRIAYCVMRIARVN
jgi:hypothetical protein